MEKVSIKSEADKYEQIIKETKLITEIKREWYGDEYEQIKKENNFIAEIKRECRKKVEQVERESNGIEIKKELIYVVRKHGV